MIIYADILFLINAFICYICLICSALILKIPLKRVRFLISSLLAGAYSLSILIDINTFLSVLLKIAVCLLIVLIAFGRLKLRLFLSSLFLFLLINCLIAGLVLALSFVNSKDFYSNIFVSYINISPIVLIISLIVCYIVVSIFTGTVFKRTAKNKIYKVTVSLNDKNYTLFGFCDSGNNLAEPFSAFPVCIVKEGKIGDLKLSENKRIIPFSSLAGEGLCEGVRAKIRINDSGKVIENDEVYIAESSEAFRDMPYDIILNPKIFDSEFSYED